MIKKIIFEMFVIFLIGIVSIYGAIQWLLVNPTTLFFCMMGLVSGIAITHFFRKLRIKYKIILDAINAAIATVDASKKEIPSEQESDYPSEIQEIQVEDFTVEDPILETVTETTFCDEEEGEAESYDNIEDLIQAFSN